MATEIIQLIAKLSADAGNFVKEMGKAATAGKQSVKEIATSTKEMASTVAVGAGAFGAAILGGLGVAAKGTMDFKNEMAGVFALLDKETRTPEMVKQLTEGAQRIRTEFGMTGAEVAEAMRTAIGSGIEAADATDFLAKSAKAAVSGMVPLKDVVQVTASAVKAFGYDVSETQRVQDALAQAVNLGTVEWKDFANGLGAVVPFAKQSGMSVEQLAGTIAELTLKGFPADQAMSSLKAALVGVQQPMPKAQQMFDRLGVTLRDSEGKARPFLDILRDVKTKLAEKGVVNVVDDKEIAKQTKKLKKLQEKVAELNQEMAGAKTAKEKAGISKKLQEANQDIAKTKKELDTVMNSVKERLDKDGTVAELFGDVNAKAVGVALMSDNLESLEGTLAEMENSAGAVEQQFEAFTDDNPRLEMERLGQQIAVLRETIGEAVIKAFQPMMKSVAETVTKITEWIAANPELAANIAKVAGVVGILAVAIGGIATVVAGIAGVVAVFSGAAIAAAAPVIGIIAIVIGVITTLAFLGKLIYDNWDGIKDFFVQMWEVIKGAFQSAWDFIKGIFDAYFNAMKFIWVDLPMSLGKLLGDALMALGGVIMQGMQWAADQFKAGWEWIKGVFVAGWEWLKKGWDAYSAVIFKIQEFMLNIFRAIWDKIKQGFENFKANMAAGWEAFKQGPKAFITWMVGLFSNAFNKIVEMFGQLWEKIKNLPGALVDKAKEAFGIGGDVPAMAAGGIVRSPTLARIGEAGPEAVIPLNSGAIPVRFDPGAMGGADGGTGGPVNIQVYQQPGEDGESLARRVAGYIQQRKGWVS